MFHHYEADDRYEYDDTDTLEFEDDQFDTKGPAMPSRPMLHINPNGRQEPLCRAPRGQPTTMFPDDYVQLGHPLCPDCLAVMRQRRAVSGTCESNRDRRERGALLDALRSRS